MISHLENAVAEDSIESDKAPKMKSIKHTRDIADKIN
jgi:hypothetical protein